MQVQIANLKEEKAQLWKDLAAEKTKEYTYVKEIRDIKASCDRRLKNMRNKYERMLRNKSKQIEDKIWVTSSALVRKIDCLAASNKSCLATVEALKDKIKLQEQYKSAIEIKRVSLLQKMNFLSSHINDLQNKLIKERKTGEEYLKQYQKIQIELNIYKGRLAEKDAVLAVLRNQMHSHKAQLENKRHAAKLQSAAAQKGIDKISELERAIQMKDTLLEQLRGQKHKIIRKNKSLVTECIALTENLQAAMEKGDELRNELQQQKDKTCEYCGL
nr:unnamed protein product [Callosobruchus analis]